jgi:hypothetical protein
MITTYLAWDDVIDVHLTLICSTLSTDATITIEHSLTLRFIASAIELV